MPVRPPALALHCGQPQVAGPCVRRLRYSTTGLQIPDILHHLSTERVITMEYVKGAAVCDKDALHRMGIKPSDVAKLVSETFNEMIFTFGDVSLSTL